MLELLLTGATPEERLDGLRGVLAAPGAGEALEAALPDLLREPDEALLVAAARGLTPLAADPAARRVLEVLARRAGDTRPVALAALRGAPG